jgi:hypothetical protein
MHRVRPDAKRLASAPERARRKDPVDGHPKAVPDRSVEVYPLRRDRWVDEFMGVYTRGFTDLNKSGNNQMEELTRDEIMERAHEIASEYGGNLTVRQLYYQFVSRGLLPSGQNVYQRVVQAVAKARLTGIIPFEWIEDRTRECKQSDVTDNLVDVDEAMSRAGFWVRSMPEWALKRSRWHGQPKHVTVGVEKEALAGVFEPTCNELGVGMFVFRGYSSLSALYQWAQNVAETDTDEAVLLYFGDHDPDGWEIPRSALRNIEEIAVATGLSLPRIRMERIALNMEQIRRYNPPPFEAKVSSSRYAGYVREHRTNDAWELDALPPNVLQQLIRTSVEREFSEDIHRANEDLVFDVREDMRLRMRTPGWLSSVFE